MIEMVNDDGVALRLEPEFYGPSVSPELAGFEARWLHDDKRAGALTRALKESLKVLIESDAALQS